MEAAKGMHIFSSSDISHLQKAGESFVIQGLFLLTLFSNFRNATKHGGVRRVWTCVRREEPGLYLPEEFLFGF